MKKLKLKLQTTTASILLMVGAIIYYIITLLLVGDTYVETRNMLLVAYFILLVTSATAYKNIARKRMFDDVSYLPIFIIYSLLFIGFLLPVVPSSSHGDMKPNTTYIAYSKTCSYCIASEKEMKRAVRVYNDSHLSKIKVVDIDKDTDIAEQLRGHITYKGAIIRTNAKNQVTTDMYTAGALDSKTHKLKPIKVGAPTIYNKFVELESYN